MSALWLPSVDARRMDAELRQRDSHLFLAEHRDFFGRPYFEVRYHVGSEHEPHVILDWREEDGTPKPLTSQIIHEVARLQQQGPPDVKKIVSRNQTLKQRNDNAHLEAYEELVTDILPRMRGTKGTIMPRTKNTHAAAKRQALRDSERKRGVR